jgi:hypothetical protein
MKTSSLVSVVILLAAASSPVHAQIYKWVDEAGKTHYSDAAPVGGKASTVADKVSFYTPDPTLIARAAASPPVNPALADRIDSLERQLQSERLARQQIELASYTQAQAAYAPYPTYAMPVAVPVRHRHPDVFRPFPGPKGTNVAGPGVMPGTFNGPNAITAGNFTFRTSVSASRGGGSAAFAPTR